MEELPKKIDLDNPEFQKAYELLKSTDANVFLTGKAGTGKSTFLRYICKNLKKKYVVLAPTGVAAVNVGGVTIHSFFQMPLRPVPPDDKDYSVASFKTSKKFSKRKRKLFKELELIIIDEVSMVRPDMIDFIDRALRGLTGRRGKPFGGVQLLLVGDIFQLEPVVTSESRAILAKYYPDFFFFNARAYSSANLISIELNKIYRQTDSRFIDLLDRIRLNRATGEDFHVLNDRIDHGSGMRATQEAEAEEHNKFGVTLASRRDTAAIINKEKMDELPAEEVVFEGVIEKDFPEKILPTDLSLVMKEGAQVMLIRNDKDKRWVNGTLAKILKINADGITIELEDGRTEKVDKEIWENINYIYDEKEKKVKEEVIGRFTQYPLKAAWALTIHKSQGLTFNNVTIDMAGGAFSAGQTYVALSRCRSLEGLKFINPLRWSDVIVSRGAAEFSKEFNNDEAVSKAVNEAKAHRLSEEARILFSEGKYHEAVERVWEVHSLVGALENKGVRRMIGKTLSVIDDLQEKLLEKDRKLRLLSQEYVEMGDMCLNELGNVESAHKNYSKAIELDGKNKEAKLGLGKCLVKTGDFKQAEKLLNDILKESTQHKTGTQYKYDILMLKGEVRAAMQDSAGAVMNYLKASKLYPGEREPYKRIISVYENAGMEELADQYREWLKNL